MQVLKGINVVGAVREVKLYGVDAEVAAEQRAPLECV